MLNVGALTRLLGAAAIVATLWLAVFWALS